MKRIIIICEGETEQEFCKTVLYPHFIRKGILIHPPLIKKTKGGIVKWAVLRNQIDLHLKQESSVFVTTMIDYYGLYAKYQFPRWDEALKISDKNRKMEMLESGMKNDIDGIQQNRFLPYLQLHEFEGLLFSNIGVFYELIPENELVGREELERIFSEFENPEMINDQTTTSPSHRLERIITGYNKIVYGNIIAEAIGLSKIREKCPRFNNWIRQLENV